MARNSSQKKRRLSYERDRRNTYGENSKSSRKAIPLRKAIDNRKHRRALNRDLQESGLGTFALAATAKARKSWWRKAPDEPLGTVITQKRRKRMRLANRKARRDRT